LYTRFPVLTLFTFLILCMSVSNLLSKHLYFTHALIRQFVHYLAPQWLPNSIPPGTSALQTFGLCQPFLSFQT
jgi:hypothetical protein